MRGGDACVALAGGDGSPDQDEGDAQHKASPPPRIIHPRPYGKTAVLPP